MRPAVQLWPPGDRSSARPAARPTASHRTSSLTLRAPLALPSCPAPSLDRSLSAPPVRPPPTHRVHKAQRDVHRAARTRVRTRDLDLIQSIDLLPERRKQLEAQDILEDKPGLGQHVRPPPP